MGINVQQLLFEFLGGLGFFLFGIKYMGEGLQRTAGDRLRDILNRFTTNPFMGVLAGMIVTGLIQSSSGTTVIIVGLVSAGFMTLRQAIGVIMGANIGTTVTAFIIGINIEEYALPFVALGAIILFFFKNKKLHSLGQIMFGLGGLFFGLDLISKGLRPLGNLEAFHELTINMSDNPILGVVIGTVFTLIIQSSSATIGILQGLFSEGLLDIHAVLPILFGDNIGTTITAVLASIGASLAAKRAAATHVLFNLIGTTIFMIFLKPFTMFITYVQDSLNLNPEMTIAVAHGTFNVTNTIIQFPFIALLAMFVTKLIPGEDTILEFNARHLETVFIEQSPSLALGQAKEEVLRMGQFAILGLSEANHYLRTKAQKHADSAIKLEEAINNLDRRITNYLIELSSNSMSENESTEHSILVNTIRDIERIGDHFENILELVDYQLAHKVDITDSAMEELEEMFQLTIATVKDAVNALDYNDKDLARNVIKNEEVIDKMERKLRKQHILRLNAGECSAQSGIVFVDIISNLERISDHAVNIAEAVLGERQ
ncbi:Na/Pi cotransporter family protein [Robertmurraya sp. Marseille-Q9965]